MQAAREHAERNGNQLVVGQDGCVEELEQPMLGRLAGGDAASKRAKRAAHFVIVATMKPPSLSQVLVAVRVTVGFYPISQPLIQFRIILTYDVNSEAKAVHNPDATGNVREVSSVTIRPHGRVRFERSTLFIGEDHPCTMGDNPSTTETGVPKHRSCSCDVRSNPQVGVQQADLLLQPHSQPFAIAFTLVDHAQEPAFATGHCADSHGDAHGGAVGTVNP